MFAVGKHSPCNICNGFFQFLLFYQEELYMENGGKANSADLDQIAPLEQSDQGLHCLLNLDISVKVL